MKKRLTSLILLAATPFLLNANVLHSEGSTSPAEESATAIVAGQEFSTQADSQLHLSPIPGVTLSLGEETRVRVVSIRTDAGKESAVVELLHGTVFTDITQAVDFTLITPDQEVKAQGTSWATYYDSENGIQRILVSGGQITVTTKRGTYTVSESELSFSDREGNHSIYRNLGNITLNERRIFLSVLSEVNELVRIAQREGVIKRKNVLAALNGSGTPVEIEVKAPVISGF